MDPNEIARIETQRTVVPPPAARPAGTPVQIPPGSESFRAAFDRAATASPAPLRFSAHAAARLQSRNITLSNDDLARLNAMAQKAADKGAKQSLFVMRDVAMVVSIKNRTVITAVDRDSMKENVFTNIDSAALL
jgi:flagellar operon protein